MYDKTLLRLVALLMLQRYLPLHLQGKLITQCYYPNTATHAMYSKPVLMAQPIASKTVDHEPHESRPALREDSELSRITKIQFWQVRMI
jgi:hypothetical protein